jgi:hypothetical protein
MRSSVSMMVVLALVTACSSQPLTGHMTGTGGESVSGATGGYQGGATGGSSGNATAATCLDIANQYQQGVAFAQTCDVGANNPCTQLVIGALSICGSCPTYVTDSSKLDLLRQRWDAGNCFNILPKTPCPLLLCAKPSSAVCAAADGGARGTCSPVYDSTGTGGASGSPIDAGIGITCDALAAKYAAALAVAKSCALGATDQCTQSTSPTLLPCRTDCVQFVNDTTELDAIRQVWEQQGCSKTGGACPPSVCSSGNGPACAATDASGPTCGTAVLLTL